MFEVIIVGGGPAGLSAALLLGRCNRNILLFDAGAHRNEKSYALHGFLSRDGYNPKEFLELCRNELIPYNVNYRQEKILHARKLPDGFELTGESGQLYKGKKLLLATGVKDELPPLEGINDFYGKSVFHCPYCDGWEMNRKKIAVYASRKQGALELSLNLKTWADDITLFTGNIAGWTQGDTAYLERNHIKVIRARISKLEGQNGYLEHVVTDKDSYAAETLFFSTGNRQSSDLAQQLGCMFTKKGAIRCNSSQETSIPGLYIAGDMAKHLQLIIEAAAEGTRAGFMINRALNAEARIK